MKKLCSKCKRVRSSNCFKKDARYSKGLFCWCKDCQSLYAKSPEVKKRNKKRWAEYVSNPENKEYERKRALEKYHRNPKKIKDQVLRRKLGISLKKFELTKRCVLCKRKVRLVADHDHISGKYRGAICHRCNLMIGWFEAIPNLAKKVKKYLRRG